MTKRRGQRTRVGDIFEIPLSDGRMAYGQYAFRDERNGPIIQVFDVILDAGAEFTQVQEYLNHAKLLFPPVITGLFVAVRTGMWKVIGHIPMKDFDYPGFVSVLHENYSPMSDWFLISAEKDIRLGKRLPKKYKNLEFLVVWSPYDIPHRIETGENPYEEMIRNG